MNKEKRKRVTLDLSQNQYERLRKLSIRAGVDSKAQVLRDAICLYDYLLDHFIEGCQFKIAYPSGQEERVVFFR